MPKLALFFLHCLIHIFVDYSCSERAWHVSQPLTSELHLQPSIENSIAVSPGSIIKESVQSGFLNIQGHTMHRLILRLYSHHASIISHQEKPGDEKYKVGDGLYLILHFSLHILCHYTWVWGWWLISACLSACCSNFLTFTWYILLDSAWSLDCPIELGNHYWW